MHCCTDGHVIHIKLSIAKEVYENILAVASSNNTSDVKVRHCNENC
jgi:hypothetical protein